MQHISIIMIPLRQLYGLLATECCSRICIPHSRHVCESDTKRRSSTAPYNSMKRGLRLGPRRGTSCLKY
uniref:Putative secreted protein n=1 Tax=Anopheles marajoara TaxID=58244 RepID=A0A2M4CFX0_9DIPT